MIEFAKGLFAGWATFLMLGYFLIKLDELECQKKYDVFACEKHVEWRPLKQQN